MLARVMASIDCPPAVQSLIRPWSLRCVWAELLLKGHQCERSVEYGAEGESKRAALLCTAQPSCGRIESTLPFAVFPGTLLHNIELNSL